MFEVHGLGGTTRHCILYASANGHRRLSMFGEDLQAQRRTFHTCDYAAPTLCQLRHAFQRSAGSSLAEIVHTSIRTLRFAVATTLKLCATAAVAMTRKKLVAHFDAVWLLWCSSRALTVEQSGEMCAWSMHTSRANISSTSQLSNECASAIAARGCEARTIMKSSHLRDTTAACTCASLAH